VFNRNAKGVRDTMRDVTDGQDPAAKFTRNASGVRGRLSPVPRSADFQNPFEPNSG
jgi:hypothetical protein